MKYSGLLTSKVKPKETNLKLESIFEQHFKKQGTVVFEEIWLNS